MAEAEGIAVAVNDNVVRRSDWSSYRLNDKDRVLMIATDSGRVKSQVLGYEVLSPPSTQILIPVPTKRNK